MQVSAPPLLSLLRSAAQAEVLTLVLLSPETEWSLTELANRTVASLSTVQREADRAELSGVVKSRRVGNVRLLSADVSSPLVPPLAELMLRAFGPPHVVSDEFDKLDLVEGLYIFGSWAARWAGEKGRPPADIDVLVVGRPDRDALDDATERVERRLARPVNVTVRSLAWWRNGTDGFHQDLATRPLIELRAVRGDQEGLS